MHNHPLVCVEIGVRGLVRRRGFTLIELLVVVAVIAVLLSVLLPALSGARRAALEVGCLNNMRQLVMAQLAYANDNDGELVDYGLSHGGGPLEADLSWVLQLQPYYEELVVARDLDLPLDQQPRVPAVLRSPLDESPHWSLPDGGQGVPVPASGGRFRLSSYGLNEHLTPTWVRTAPPFLQPAKFDRIDLVRRPFGTVQWVMMAYEGEFAGSDHVHTINWWIGDFAPDAPPGIAATVMRSDAAGGEQAVLGGGGQVISASRDARSHYAYLDGHVKGETFDDVYEGPLRNCFDPKYPMR